MNSMNSACCRYFCRAGLFISLLIRQKELFIYLSLFPLCMPKSMPKDEQEPAQEQSKPAQKQAAASQRYAGSAQKQSGSAQEQEEPAQAQAKPKKLRILQPTDSPSVNLALDTLRLGKQALVFANTKRSAEKVAEDIAEKIKKERITGENVLFEISEKARTSLPHPTTQCERLARCMKKGVAFHHAGLTQKQKDIIEEEFKRGTIKIICCTPTLAYGIDLPAFRSIIRDLRRYGKRGLAWIPVLDYQQICGRAGRPSYDSFGEAIAVASTEQERDKIREIYIEGEAEEIYSKLAVEPVLRTYILSLIAAEFAADRKQLVDFFSRTFWAYQFEDMEKLDSIIEKMLNLLVEYGFIRDEQAETGAKKDAQQAKATGIRHASQIKARKAERYAEEMLLTDEQQAFDEFDGFISAADIRKEVKSGENEGIRTGGKLGATAIGRRVAQLYIDPLTAHDLLTAVKRAESKQATDFSFIHLAASCLEMRPLLRVKQAEYGTIAEALDKKEGSIISSEPGEHDLEYDEFLNSFKTALFLEDWMDEKDEEYLLEKYAVRPGELRAKLELADWLLYAAEELAKLAKHHAIVKGILKTRYRLKYGVKEELLPLLRLKGIGRVRARRLFAAGFKDVGEIKKADIMSLVQILGRNTAISLKKQVGVDVDKQKVPERKRKGQVSLKDFS